MDVILRYTDGGFHVPGWGRLECRDVQPARQGCRCQRIHRGWESDSTSQGFGGWGLVWPSPCQPPGVVGWTMGTLTDRRKRLELLNRQKKGGQWAQHGRASHRVTGNRASLLVRRQLGRLGRMWHLWYLRAPSGLQKDQERQQVSVWKKRASPRMATSSGPVCPWGSGRSLWPAGRSSA